MMPNATAGRASGGQHNCSIAHLYARLALSAAVWAAYGERWSAFDDDSLAVLALCAQRAVWTGHSVRLRMHELSGCD